MSARYRFSGFELDPVEARLTRDGAPLELQPKVFEALTLLVTSGGRLVSKEELPAHLWPDTFVTEESLTQVVSKLRLALGDEPRNPRFVQTVLKRGYRFLPSVETIEGAPAVAATPGDPRGEAPASAPPVERVIEPPPPGAVRAPRRWLGPALAGGCVVAALAGWKLLAPQTARARFDPANADRVRLTATAERESMPAFAPDDRSYVFVANRRGEGQLDLYTAVLDGGRAVRLTESPQEDFAPQYAPDGSRILFTRGDADKHTDLWTVAPLGGGEQLVVADAEAGVWSPDGHDVAFVRPLEGGGAALVRCRLDGGEERILHRSKSWLATPAWSPDGKRIAFNEGHQVFVVSAEGGTPQAIGAAAVYLRSLAWETSGTELIVAGSWPREWGGIWRLPVDGGPREPLVAGGSVFDPAISRDSRRLLFTEESKTGQVWRVKGDGGKPQLLPLPVTVECFDVSADGKHLAFTDLAPSPGGGQLGWFELESGAVRPLGDGLCPAIAPSGTRLAFFGGVGQRGLWVLDLATGARRRVIEDRGPEGLIEESLARRPAWSPDGARLAFRALGTEEGDGLRIVEVDSGRERLLARGSFEVPAWSPDGRSIAACLHRDGSFLPAIVDAASGAVRLLSGSCPFREGPIWEADSRRLRLLSGERSRPTLVGLSSDGQPPAAEIPLQHPDDPAFWGIFVVRRGGPDAWIYLLERYESDLYLLTSRERRAR